MNTTKPHEFLSLEFERRIRANAQYSLRAFARDLKLSPGELSEVLNHKRNLSIKKILRLAKTLGLSPSEIQDLLTPHAIETVTPPKELSAELFRVVSDWYCFAILNLADTRGARLEPAYIARRLAISVTEARLALERMLAIGLLERAQGRLKVDPEFVMSPDGIASEAIRNHHRQMLDKAAQSLETQSLAERDITGIGFSIDPRDLPELKKDIRKFQDQLIARYSDRVPTPRKTEVYQLEMALFRLTQKEKSS